jgi:hypothetical protein
LIVILIREKTKADHPETGVIKSFERIPVVEHTSYSSIISLFV